MLDSTMRHGAASSQQQMADGPWPSVASSATGRQPLADDRSSRRSSVKEGTRGQAGLGSKPLPVTETSAAILLGLEGGGLT
jgi:hypothetical protein